MRPILAFVALLLISCGFLDEPGVPVAKVGDRTLTRDQLGWSLAPHDSSNAELRLALVRDWVNQEVLYQEALRQSLQADPEIAWLLQDAHRKIMTSAFTERIVRSLPDPDEGKLEAFYAANGSEFQLINPRYHVSLQVHENAKNAWDAYKALPKGVWDTIQQWQSLSSMDSCLKIPIEKAKIGVASTPVNCGDSLVLVRVDAVRPQGDRLTFEEARPAVLKALRRMQREHIVDSVLKAAKARHPVFTWPENISSERPHE